MRAGLIEQVGTPLEIYGDPDSFFVADFFGSPSMNLISGNVQISGGGAAFEEPTAGEIFIGGEKVNDFEPGDRNLGMVFQSHALFPHKTVYQNIEFGPRMKKVDPDTRRRRVLEVAEMVRITDLLDKLPGQCSGGEAQRVALARTLITDPSAFLLDEPLSSLDAKLRREMRAEIDRLHQELNKAFIYVTHDQEEAMTLADRIVYMTDKNHGLHILHCTV